MKFLPLALIAGASLVQSCGQNSSSNVEIYGGRVVTSGDILKRVVALRLSGSITCTGVLLSEKHVLTAGHCIPEYTPSLAEEPREARLISVQRARLTMDVAFGTTSNSPKQVRKVVRWEVHPGWREFMLRVYDILDRDKVGAATQADADYISQKVDKGNWHDIAVVEFAGGIPQGYEVAKVLEERVLPGQKLVLAGFGISEIGRQDHSTLQQTESKVEASLLDVGEFKVDGQSGRGPCKGDSGGPAFVVQNNTLFVAGVVSRNNASDTCQGADAIYTSVKGQYDWLARYLPATTPSPIVTPVPVPEPTRGTSTVLDVASAQRCSDARAFSEFTRKEIAKEICSQVSPSDKQACLTQCYELAGLVTPPPLPQSVVVATQDTYLKLRVAQSSELAEEEKCFIPAGTRIEVKSRPSSFTDAHQALVLTSVVPSCPHFATSGPVYIYAPHFR